MKDDSITLISEIKATIKAMGLKDCDVRMEEQHGEVIILTGLALRRNWNTDTLKNMSKCRCCGDLLTDDREYCCMCNSHRKVYYTDYNKDNV